MHRSSLSPDPALHVAVIGAGLQGRSFAAACAAARFTVALEDVMPEKLRHAEQQFLALGHAVRLVSTVEDAVRDAGLVIDFVPDDLESKLEIWSLLDRMAPPKTILCTPSEVLSITDLASCTYRPDRCVMIRGPLSKPGHLKLIYADQTSEATREVGVGVFAALGFTVAQMADPDLPMLLKNMRAPDLR